MSNTLMLESNPNCYRYWTLIAVQGAGGDIESQVASHHKGSDKSQPTREEFVWKEMIYSKEKRKKKNKKVI